MGWKKKYRRYKKKVKRAFKSAGSKVERYGKRAGKKLKKVGRQYGSVATGGLWNPQGRAGDYRSQAAAPQRQKVQRGVTRQGGSGQVQYTGEFVE